MDASDNQEMESISEFAAALPPGVQLFPIERIPGLSVRARGGLPRNDVLRIEDLIGLADATVGSWQNFGAGAVESIRAGLRELMTLAQAEPAMMAGAYEEVVQRLTAFVPYLQAVEASWEGMSAAEVAIVRQRLLPEGEASTLEAVAEPFGLTRERIRQIELKLRAALDPQGDLRTASSARLARLREGRTTPLSLVDLERRDPWFVGVADRPAFFAATLDALGSDHAVAAWDGAAPFVSARAAMPPGQLLQRFRAAKDACVSAAGLDEAVGSLLESCSAPELTSEFRARLDDFIVCQRGLVFDPSLQDHVESIFLAAKGPLTMVEAGRRLNRAGVTVAKHGVRSFVDRFDLVRTGPSEYVLPARLVEFDEQAAPLYEAVAPLLEASSERQWSTAELLEALGRGWAAALPEYAAEYLLGREAAPCRKLGRGMWVSRLAKTRTRVHLVEVCTEILEEAGEPLARGELAERVRRIRGFKYQLVIQWPVVYLSDGRYGLGPRDLGVPQAAFDVVMPEVQRRLAETGRVSGAALRGLLEACGLPMSAVDPVLLSRAFRVGSRMQIDGSGEGDGLRRHDVAREGIEFKVPRWAPTGGRPRRRAPRRVAPKPAPTQPVQPDAAEARPRAEKSPRPRRCLSTAEVQARVRAKLGQDLPPRTLSLRLRLAGWAYDPATDMWERGEDL